MFAVHLFVIKNQGALNSFNSEAWLSPNNETGGAFSFFDPHPHHTMQWEVPQSKLGDAAQEYIQQTDFLLIQLLLDYWRIIRV